MTIISAQNILTGNVEFIGKYVFKAAALVLGSMPGRLRLFIADGCALAWYLVSPVRRRNVRDNLTVVGAGPTGCLGVFKTHCRNVTEIFASSRWWTSDVIERVDFPGRRVLDDALANGRGAIVATAHIGNWELAARYLSALGYRMHVIAGVQLNRLLTGAVKDAKEQLGIEVINPEHSYRRLFKALRDGGIVALLVDGDIYETGKRIRFFGLPTLLPTGAVRLSRSSGAPLLGGYCRRLAGNRYRINLETIMTGDEVASSTEQESLQRLYEHIERYIHDNIDQWCIFRRLWRDGS